MSAQTSVVPHLPAASRLALRDQLAERLESAAAPSTRAAYRRGWGQFSAWASDQLARSGRKPSSIRFALAAIAAGHRAADLESPITEGVRRTVQVFMQMVPSMRVSM